jgi:hypothetical protein
MAFPFAPLSELLAVGEPIARFIILARWQQSGMKIATIIDL